MIALPPVPEMEPGVAAIVSTPKARAYYDAILAEHRAAQMRLEQHERVTACRAREAARWDAAEEWCDANTGALLDGDFWKREVGRRNLNTHLDRIADLAHIAARDQGWIDLWEAERLAAAPAPRCDICPGGARGGEHDPWCPEAKKASKPIGPA